MGVRIGRKYFESKTLVRCVAGASGTATPRLTVKNPSAFLRCKVDFSYEVATNAATPTISSSNVTITAFSQNPISGKIRQGPALRSSKALPYAYELDSSVDHIDVTSELAAPSSGDGSYVALISWECDPTVPEHMIDELFALCDATVKEASPLT